MVCVDLFVPTLNKSNFTLNLDESGNYLEIHTVLPDIFTDVRRIEKIHEQNPDLNKNSSRFTAFTKMLKKFEKKKNRDNEDTTETGIKINLPFKCDPDSLFWEVQTTPNLDLGIDAVKDQYSIVINASVHASEQENYSKKEPVVENFVLGNLSPGSKKRKLENDDRDGDLDNYDDDMDGI